jgi:hypothetical protein
MGAGMAVYLGNLPPRASADEVRAFLLATLDRNMPRRLVQAIFRNFEFARDLRMQVIEKRSRRRRYRFAHLQFADACVARFFIEELNGLRMRGQRLVAREFFHRANDYEDYEAQAQRAAWSGRERRAENAVPPPRPRPPTTPLAPGK